MGRVELIAEVKTSSPFGYVSEESWDELFLLAENVGDIISVHTDPRWGGSLDLLRKARSLTQKPLLAKGIHTTDEELDAVFEAGADWALCVGRLPTRHLERCLIEPISLQELAEIPKHLRVVWNSRDLSNGATKSTSFAEAREVFKGWLCQASNIKTMQDIEVGANAILVGTHLREFSKTWKQLHIT